MTFKQCFDKVGKETAKKFDSQIKAAINQRKEDKINIILVDKNYPQGIGKFLKLFCKDMSSQFFLVFIPTIKARAATTASARRTPLRCAAIWPPLP